MGPLIFIVNNFLAALICALIAELAIKNRSIRLKVLATISTFPVLIVLILIILGLAGKLTACSATIFLGFISLVLLIIIYRKKKSLIELKDIQSPTEKKERFRWFLLMLVLAGTAGLIAGRFIITGTEFCSDDFGYHAFYPAKWLIEQCLSAPSGQLSSYYPYNAELFSLWFMLPFHNDALVSLAGFYWLGLLVLSGILILWEYTNAKSAVILGVVLITASPVLRASTRTFSAVDLVLPSMLLSIIALYILLKKKPNSSAPMVGAVYAGLLAGFALGSKISFAPVCVIFFIWLLFSGKTHTSPLKRCNSAAIFIGGVFISGSFWYLRNYIITGNPVFPAEVGPFDGPFLAEQIHRTKLISWIANGFSNIPQWKLILQKYIQWPPAMFMLSFAGYIIYIINRLRIGKPDNPFRLNPIFLLWGTGIIMIVLYPLMPFSGATNSPEAPLELQLRYLITPFIIGLILFLLSFKKGSAGHVPLILTAIVAMILPWKLQHFHLMATLAILGVALLAWYLWVKTERLLRRISFHTLFFPFIYSSLLMGVVIFLPHQIRLTNRNIFQRSGALKLMGAAWEAVGELPAPARITAVDPWVFGRYSLYGRNYQLTPCIVNPNGTLRETLHIRWKEDPHNTKLWQKRRQPDPDKYLDNLIMARIDYVLVVKSRNLEWPKQYQILEASEQSQCVYNNGFATIWRIPQSIPPK